MERGKIEKVIPVCGRPVATAEEILKQCGMVCRINFQNNEQSGLLSCSHATDISHLTLCIWKAKGENKYESVTRVRMGEAGLIMLRGFASEALKIKPEHSG